MSGKILAIVGVVALGLGAAAQAQQGAQAGASSQTNANAQVDRKGAQTSGSGSNSATAQAGRNSAGLESGTTMNAALEHPVDAKKNKPGDHVTAKTTDNVKSGGQVVIPKGSRLEGHVTQVQARGHGQSDSSVGIVFDRAVTKKGREIPLNNFAIQAVGRSQSSASAMSSSNSGPDMMSSGGGSGSSRSSGGGMSSGHSSGGGLLGGATSSVGGTVNTTGGVTSGVSGGATSTVSDAGRVTGGAGGVVGGTVSGTTGVTSGVTSGGLNSSGQLMSNSRGVFGLEGLGLQSAASSNAQGSVITSSSRNVHLDSGTQLVLAAQGQAQGGQQ
jgi:hypothetical protein